MRKHIGDIILLVSALALTAFIAFLASSAYGAPEAEIVPVAPPQFTFETNVREVAEAEAVEEPLLVSLGRFKVTHYCPCEICCGKSDGITATGTYATPGRTLAVDPSVIPFGSKVLLKYEDGTTDDYIAEDRGGAIKGNRVDVFMGQHKAALHAGVRYAEVFLVGGER
jgi:3D (Asp-Asp-Asp) domain-containing protein